MKKLSNILFLLFLLLMGNCVEPIDADTIGFEDLLVVEGLITDQPVHQLITLTRTSPLGSDSASIRYETEAIVYVIDNNNERYEFQEADSGNYYSLIPFAALAENPLQLFIETANGQAYASDKVAMVATPPLDSIYAEFFPSNMSGERFGGNFRFYVDAKNNPNDNRFFRWTWNTTYEIQVPFPSRWLWTGDNNFIIRELGGENDELQVERCWKTEYTDRILTRELTVPSSGIERLQITEFNSSSRKLLRGYSVEVKQYGLSQTSFNYWNELEQVTLAQGSLADKQLGTITGNIICTSDPNQIVLGIFEVAEEVSMRRQFDPLEFSDQGYRREQIYISDCDDLEPVTSAVDQIGATMERLGPGFTLTYFITSPPGAFYYPLRCSDCTIFGSNQRPEFWQ